LNIPWTGEAMRKLSELIILIRGGGEIGSAVAHRLSRSHFRVCIAETNEPLAVNRGTCFSEAIYDSTKTIEGVTAEKTTISLENIYKVWRNGKIPIVADPDLSVKPFILPDVLINAMMLKRETSTKMSDAPLVIGIGNGFGAGENVHMVIDSNQGNDLGRVIIDGKPAALPDKPKGIGELVDEGILWSEDSGTFISGKSIGDTVSMDDIVGKVDEVPLKAPISGILRGLIRNDVKVLAHTRLAEIDPVNTKSVCFSIRDSARAIAGGVLEAVMLGYNVDETS
jgi:xanthine dehydrogenase accessory factor